MSPVGDSPENEAIVEFHRVGTSLKVVAVDPVTGTEVSMVGDPRASQQELMRLAVQKLRFVMAKKGQG